LESTGIIFFLFYSWKSTLAFQIYITFMQNVFQRSLPGKAWKAWGQTSVLILMNRTKDYLVFKESKKTSVGSRNGELL
jgi:hypothetical protein